MKFQTQVKDQQYVVMLKKKFHNPQILQVITKLSIKNNHGS